MAMALIHLTKTLVVLFVPLEGALLKSTISSLGAGIPNFYREKWVFANVLPGLEFLMWC